MQIKFQSKFSVTSCFLLLMAQRMSCQTDTRQEVGDKLGETIKTAGLELFDSHIAELTALLAKLLKVGKPSAAQAEKLKSDILDLEKLSAEKSEMTPPQLVEAIKSFMQDKYGFYLRNIARSSHDYEADALAVEAILTSTQKGAEYCKKFAMTVYEAWTELYEALSKEELAEHAEYASINELMQGVERTSGAGVVFIDVIKALIKFFDYKDWQFFLEIKN